MKISFLLGAGASKPFGVPTTEDMAREFLEKKNDPELEFALGEKDSRDIESLIRVVQRIRDLEFNEGLTLADVDSSIIDIIKLNSRNFEETQREIYEFIREKCHKSDIEKAEKTYKPLFDLSEQTPIDIFTTNYDMTIEEVCRTLRIYYIDGFKQEEHGYNKIFSPMNFKEGQLRLVKLHGSINWWSDHKRLKIFSLDPQFSGIEGLNNLMIYPAEKDDVFNYPFNILHLFFNVMMNQTTDLIAIGHKFGDKNILSTVTAMLERPDFKLTIVDPLANKIKKDVFKNNERVIIIEQSFEKWVEDGGIMNIALQVALEKGTASMSSEKNQPVVKDSPPIQTHTLSATDHISDASTLYVNPITGIFGQRQIPYAKHLPEATDESQKNQYDILNLSYSAYTAIGPKRHRKCPKCEKEFVVGPTLTSFNCPHCHVRLYDDLPS